MQMEGSIYEYNDKVTIRIASIHGNLGRNENMKLSGGNEFVKCHVGKVKILWKGRGNHCIAGSPQTPLADSHFTKATYIRSH